MKKIIKSLLVMTALLVSGNLAACKKDPTNSSTQNISSSSEVLNSTSSSPTTVKHTVTFMNGTVVFDTQSIEDNKTASKPSTDPIKENFGFDNWYVELNSDGTGKGQAFVFTTKITKDITLHAAFSEDESITVFFADDRGGLYPQKVYTDSTLQPSAYTLAYYDCSNYMALLLEEDTTGFELPSEYVYQDITDSENLIFTYQTYNKYEYYDEVNDILSQELVYDDYSFSLIMGSEYNVQYYIFEQIQLIIVDDFQDGRTYVMFENNDITSVYIILDMENLGNDVLVDDEFINNHCYNGIAIVGMKNILLKDGYLELSFNGSTPDGIWYYENVIVEEDQEFNYDIYAVEAYDLKVYYRSYKKVEGTITHNEVLSAESIDLYNSKIAEGVESFIEDGVEYFINEGNGIYNIYCQKYDGEAYCQYWVYIRNGNLVRAEYYAFDGMDYNFYFIDKDGNTYIEEDIPLVGNTLPSEQFENCQKLGFTSVYISCYYVLDDTYIEVYFYNDFGFYNSIYVQAGQEFDLPNPYEDDVEVEYTLYNIVPVELDDIDFVFDYLDINELYANYSDKFNIGWFYIGDFEYHINEQDGEINYVACSIEIEGVSYQYNIRYINDQIDTIDYSIDDVGYTLILDTNENIVSAIMWEKIPFTQNSISQEIFDVYRLYNQESILIKLSSK